MRIIRPPSNQPIPENAKVVFKGIMFDVFQWEQVMYDGSKTTFEKVKRADTVSVLPVTLEGKIILCRQEQPGTKAFISGFGGRIDEGEDPFEAAKRELLEETGMISKNWELWDSKQPSDKIEFAMYVFIAKNVEKIQEPRTDSGEKIEVFEVSFDELVKISSQDNFRDTEISLKMFRALQNEGLEEIRKKLNP